MSASTSMIAMQHFSMQKMQSFLQDLRSTAFRYLLQHGVPGPTWGDCEFLPTARRPGRTRQGGGIATTSCLFFL